MVQTWMVIVDGSDISHKAVQVAASFMTNEDEEDDELVVVHSFDPATAASLPAHRTPDHITNQFDAEIVKARACYDVTGPTPLIARCVALPHKPNGGPVGARNAILAHAEQEVLPDVLFIGSFGAGGDKIDENGTMSDGVARLAKCSVAIVKNTWPVPDFKTGAKFVVGIDGGPNSIEAAWLIRRLVKPHDTMECVIVCVCETSREKEILALVQKKLATARGPEKNDEVKCEFKSIVSESVGKEGVAKMLCSYAQRADADFLVTGSQGPDTAKKARRTIPFGEVSALCANASRTHFMCMKPEFIYQTHAPQQVQVASGGAAIGTKPVMLSRTKRSGSFVGKAASMGGFVGRPGADQQ